MTAPPWAVLCWGLLPFKRVFSFPLLPNSCSYDVMWSLGLVLYYYKALTYNIKCIEAIAAVIWYFSSSLSWPQRIWVGWTLCPTPLSLINQQEHVRTVFFFILLLFFLLVCHLLLATSSSASQSGSTSSPQTLKRQQVWTFLCHCVKLKEKASVLTLYRPSAVVTVMHYSAKRLLFKENECKVLQRLQTTERRMRFKLG